MLFLSIDFGTSAVKLSIVDEKRNVLNWVKCDYPYILLPGEKVELDPGEFWSALFHASSKLDGDLKARVEHICYDTFSPSPVFMDENGNLTYPNIITHMDRRSRAQTQFIDDVMGKDNYMNISGIYPFPGGCSAMTLIWFLQNEPKVYEKTYRIGHLPTYIHKKFTGEWMVDLVNASMTGLYETTTQGGWSDVLINTFGLQKKWFADIYNPGVVLGTLLPDMAEILGNVQPGIPVSVGTNDVAAAQMGAGNQKAGDIMDTAGSSEMISILTDIPSVNPHYYLRNAALPGLWQIYATTAGGFAVDWFYKEFCREIPKKEFYGSYIVKCIETYLGYQDVTFDPYLTGDRQSLQKKTGAFHGLTLQATREEMLAALLRSIQGVLKITMSEAAEVVSLSKQIKISGGMVTDAYIKMKEMEFSGYEFLKVDNCPILGNVILAQYYMNQ